MGNSPGWWAATVAVPRNAQRKNKHKIAHDGIGNIIYNITLITLRASLASNTFQGPCGVGSFVICKTITRVIPDTNTQRQYCWREPSRLRDVPGRE